MATTPTYLTAFEGTYAEDPRAAALEWFRDAKYGMFLHYGLYSLVGRHEWVQFREKIPVAEYARLAEQFTAEGFDADAFCQLAVDAGMKYINITTRHHDSFCLFKTQQTDFQSPNAPANRDLIGELCKACDEHGLGFFCYYSHGRDWRHAHAPRPQDYDKTARPDYDEPQPEYASDDEYDLQIYVDFMTAQITELLTQYYPIAGIWLDGIATPVAGDVAPFRCQDLYDLIHMLQPQVLASYKQGLLGTEDFFAPEHKAAPERAGRAMEICTTMCPRSWGYLEEGKGKHLSADDVWQKLGESRQAGANLLLNTGPLPDGSIDPEDAPVLREGGERLRTEGFPT